MTNPISRPATNADSQVEWLRWLISAFGIWLLVSTRGLWWNWGGYPQIPWFGWGCLIPRFVDVILLVGVVISLIFISVTDLQSRLNRVGLLVSSACLLGLMLLDQHRCQPWAYQLVLMMLTLATVPSDQAVRLLRLLTISIYIHSAVSKCDASFCSGLGRSFLATMWELLFNRPQDAKWQAGVWPLLFPIGELAIGLGLIWPASRRIALWIGIGMHLLLLIILGPWGLNHSTGVLIWNLFFITQNLVLFGGFMSGRGRAFRDPTHLSCGAQEPNQSSVDLVLWPFCTGSGVREKHALPSPLTPSSSPPSTGARGVKTVDGLRSSRDAAHSPDSLDASGSAVVSTYQWLAGRFRFAYVMIGWAVVWPCLEPWEICDLWPAWGLYAQHGEQLQMFVSEGGLRRLPADWQASANLIETQYKATPWQLRPQLVSLRSVGAPVYPQNRYLLGVIQSLSRDYNLTDSDVMVFWQFPANRWTGERRTQVLTNLAQFNQRSARCLFNAQPRP